MYLLYEVLNFTKRYYANILILMQYEFLFLLILLYDIIYSVNNYNLFSRLFFYIASLILITNFCFIFLCYVMFLTFQYFELYVIEYILLQCYNLLIENYIQK